MGNCGSNNASNSPDVLRSKELDKVIREDEKRQTKEVKLLLLGAGESGKSTILKSMRLIHDIPFTSTERETYRRLVFLNIVAGIRSLLEAMEEWEESLENQENVTFLPLFVSFPDIAQGEGFPQVYYHALRALWKDGGLQDAHRRAHEIALPENLPYYFAELDRLWRPEYIPSDADILRCRNKTTGIIETLFPLEDKIYRIFDVGGQRSERKKWIHCFENVTAVLFVVALSGYDCCLLEDQDSNQMQEALMLFDSIVNSKWFVRTSMIIFLNKVDIFRDKISQSSIREYFPDFPTDQDDADYDCARTFFKARFLKCNRSKSKEVYPSFTNATDPALLKIVMTSVTDIILSAGLRDNML